MTGDGQCGDGGAGFFCGDLAVLDGFLREGDRFRCKVDGGVDAVKVGEVPDMLPESLRPPVDVVACGLAAGKVVGGEIVVDEAGDDGFSGGDGLGEKTTAHGHARFVADASRAFGKEDDGKAVAEALSHAFCGLGCGATGPASNVDGAGHHTDPSKDWCAAEFDLGDEDAGSH